ncbi:MAG: hypothetical protein KGL39_53565, partial [Patescibacteria group bacterium]|nr:hypothetical protein [Patescibacteria group bacterium]
MDRLTEVLERIIREARHYLAKPAELEDRGRLLSAIEEAERALGTQADELTLDGILGPPWAQTEGWDPSWFGSRCRSCGHLNPATANTVNAPSRKCQACGGSMRVYAMEDLWARADEGPRSASILPLEAMDPFAEGAIQLTPEALALFLHEIAFPPPFAPALLRAFNRRQALGMNGDAESLSEISTELA